MNALEKAMGNGGARLWALLRSTFTWGLLASVAVLAIILQLLYAYRVTAHSVRKVVRTDNATAAGLAGELMSRELGRRLDLARVVAGMPGLVEAVERRDEEAVRARLKVVVTTYEGVDRAVLSDTNAFLWSDYPRAPEVLGQTFTQRDWYRGVTNGWQPYVSEVFLRQAKPSVLVVGLSTPIRKGDQVIGILLHHYRLDAITGWLKEVRLGETGHVFVLDHTGTIAAHPELDLSAKEHDEYATLPGVTRALAGAASSEEYRDPVSGQKMLASFVPVRAGRKYWVVVAQQPVREAYAAVRTMELQLGVGAAILALASIVVVVLLGHGTERTRRLDRQLTEERNLLRSLIDNSPDLIYVKDTQSRFLIGNVALAQFVGCKESQDLLGKDDFAFFPAPMAQQFRDDEAEVCRSGQPLINREEAAIDREGNQRWFSTTKVPLRDREGRVVGLVGIGRDITKRKRAELQLEVAKQAAEEGSRAKSEFLAHMSHELRTPLNSVIGFAGILLRKKPERLEAEDQVFLERILANARHLLGLINQVLDLSKIEAHKTDLEPSWVALDRLVPEVLSQFESQVQDRGLSLRSDLPQPMAPLWTDENKLKQVLINLIGNAVKFTEQGSVSVRVGVDPATRRPTSVEVADTGIGILKDRQEAIFDAFHQADRGTSRRFGGTGLGLTISRSLCQLMGLTLEVESEPGQGSSFTIRIPPGAVFLEPAAAGPEPVSAMPAAALGPALLGQKHVLVIDDEADSRLLLARLVEECGCRVTAAGSGEDGLRLARALRPDLITLDLLMPQKDGWAVLKELKVDPDLSGIPVVVVSVVGNEHRGTLLSAREVLQKPVSRENLLRVLKPFVQPKVLLIEDNEDDRRLMGAHLAGAALEVRVAETGPEALSLLESFQPDLILLDLMMPRMDGMTFLARLRKDSRFDRIPVVVVTARDLTPAEQRRLSAEAHAILRKSNDWGEDLRRLLPQLLKAEGRRRPGAAIRPGAASALEDGSPSGNRP